MYLKKSKNLRSLVSLIATLLVICSLIALVPAGAVFADNQKGTVQNVNVAVNLRKRASTGSEIVKQIPLGTELTVEQIVNSESDDHSGYSKWCKVSCTVGGQTYTGYVADYFVKVDPNATPAPTAAPTSIPTIPPVVSATPTATAAPTASVTPTVVATATPSATVTPTTSVTPTASVAPTASVTPTVSVTPTASVAPTASVTPVPTAAPVTPAKTFDEQLAQFPESYKPMIKALHEKHPNWIFVAQTAPKSWSELMTIETRSGGSLVQNTAEDSWKSKATEHYDPKTKQYKVIDSPNWVNASRAIVAYYLDPRNSLTEEAVFQFLDLSYNLSSIPNNSDTYVSKVLDGTFMKDASGSYAGSSLKYDQLIAIAGYESRINPIFLSARIVQEVGVNGSSSSDGATGYYNFYNIGAYSDATNAAYVGLKFAQFGNGVENSDYNQKFMIPWTTQGSSIIGGAKWISSNYTTQGQNSIYYMKFNVSPDTVSRVGYHQYMTAITSPTAEATRMFNAYSKTGLVDSKLTFVIPVFSGMPVAIAPLPTAANANTEFVTRTYSAILGRTPTADEISRMSTTLSNGGAAVDSIANVLFSKEFTDKKLDNDKQIEILFKLLVNREPDANGKKFCEDLIKQGHGMSYVYAAIANSEEAQKFISTYGIYPGYYTVDDLVDSNMALKPFVEGLYSGFMEREPDKEGLHTWISVLANKSKSGQDVANAFYKSPEFQGFNLSNEDFVKRLYNVCLGRAADADGIKYWVGELDASKSRDYIFSGFVNSKEFNDLCASYNIATSQIVCTKMYDFKYNKDKGSEFVTRLYTEALGREAEKEGLEYWTTQLSKGMDGREVASGFVFSKELEDMKLTNEQFVTKMYKIFLNRDAEADGLKYWTTKLTDGASKKDVFEGFVYSDEYVKLCMNAGIVPNANYKK